MGQTLALEKASTYYVNWPFITCYFLGIPKERLSYKLVIPYHYFHLSLHRIACKVRMPFVLFLPGQCAVEAMHQLSPGINLSPFVPALSSTPAGWQCTSDFQSFSGAPPLCTALGLLLASERKEESCCAPKS